MNNQPNKPSQQDQQRQPGPGKGRMGFPPFIYWIIFIVLAYLAFQFMMPGQQGGKQITYTQFKQDVQQGKIDSLTVQGDQISGTYAGQQTKKERAFQTVIPPYAGNSLSTLLDTSKVVVQAKSTQTNIWDTLLVTGLPFLLIIGLFLWLGSRARKQAGGLMSIGKSRAKLFTKEQVQTTFDDVAGYQEQKEALQETIRFLKHPEEFQRLSAKVPKGVLLIGPPGTGKTLMARAVAGEAGVPFFHLSGSDFMEMLVGVGASRVRDLFGKAKKSSPSIIFLDELDSIGQRRGGTRISGGHDEREQTLNQLLSEMDGFEPTEGVIVFAATNRPDVLDEALLRPGRFDRRVQVDLPNMRERLEILKVHTKKVPLADDVNLDDLARSTPGQSGADLENLVNEAAINAVKDKADAVNKIHFQVARDKIMMGMKRSSLILSDDEKERISIHESGHTLVAELQDQTDPVEKVTIIPRGRSLGATQQLPEDERHNFNQEYLEQRIAVMMGGRAAEKLIFNEITTGAESDLVQATRLARKMVSNWGMSEKIGNIAFRQEDGMPQPWMQNEQYSDHLSEMIDDEARTILDRCFRKAYGLLENHRSTLKSLSRRLLEKEVIQGAELKEILQGETEEAAQEEETENEPSESLEE